MKLPFCQRHSFFHILVVHVMVLLLLTMPCTQAGDILRVGGGAETKKEGRGNDKRRKKAHRVSGKSEIVKGSAVRVQHAVQGGCVMRERVCTVHKRFDEAQFGAT